MYLISFIFTATTAYTTTSPATQSRHRPKGRNEEIFRVKRVELYTWRSPCLLTARPYQNKSVMLPVRVKTFLSLARSIESTGNIYTFKQFY